MLANCLADLGDLLVVVTGALRDADRVPSPLAGQEVLNFPELPVQRKLHILHFFPSPHKPEFRLAGGEPGVALR